MPRTQKGSSLLLHHLLQAPCRGLVQTKQVKLLFGMVSGTGTFWAAMAFQERTQRSANLKTRSNSFHSTFEPNTEVFSKVSRSLAQLTLVNSVSTLLNKEDSTCNCLVRLRTSENTKTNQSKCTATLLHCASEAKVGGQSG